MRQVRILNRTQQRCLATKGEVADSFLQRARGLLGRSSLELEHALVIMPSNGVHSFFMRFPIDVVHVSNEGRVCALIQPLDPNRIGPIKRDSHYVIELPAGTIERTCTKLGDQIELEDVS